MYKLPKVIVRILLKSMSFVVDAVSHLGLISGDYFVGFFHRLKSEELKDFSRWFCHRWQKINTLGREVAFFTSAVIFSKAPSGCVSFGALLL